MNHGTYFSSAEGICEILQYFLTLLFMREYQITSNEKNTDSFFSDKSISMNSISIFPLFSLIVFICYVIKIFFQKKICCLDI